jgi:putative hydrolase
MEMREAERAGITTGSQAPRAWERVVEPVRDHGVAVEINCRPERQDPPDRLLSLAVEAGCLFAIDTDAHAPGQLDWLDSGCARAEQHGIQPSQIINTRGAGSLTGK